MTRRALIAVLRTFAIVALALSVAPQPVPAQKAAPAKKETAPTPYNPYPPGILPADLQSEIDRVRREVRFIFLQALAQWRALPPPNLTGQPPTLQGSGYELSSAEELHPHALPEPYVSLSTHTAPINQPMASPPGAASVRTMSVDVVRSPPANVPPADDAPAAVCTYALPTKPR